MKTIKELGIKVTFDNGGMEVDLQELVGTERTTELTVDIHCALITEVLNSGISQEKKYITLENLIAHSHHELFEVSMGDFMRTLDDDDEELDCENCEDEDCLSNPNYNEEG